MANRSGVQWRGGYIGAIFMFRAMASALYAVFVFHVEWCTRKP